jgi:hypothetical protein
LVRVDRADGNNVLITSLYGRGTVYSVSPQGMPQLAAMPPQGGQAIAAARTPDGVVILQAVGPSLVANTVSFGSDLVTPYALPDAPSDTVGFAAAAIAYIGPDEFVAVLVRELGAGGFELGLTTNEGMNWTPITPLSSPPPAHSIHVAWDGPARMARVVSPSPQLSYDTVLAFDVGQAISRHDLGTGQPPGIAVFDLQIAPTSGALAIGAATGLATGTPPSLLAGILPTPMGYMLSELRGAPVAMGGAPFANATGRWLGTDLRFFGIVGQNGADGGASVGMNLYVDNALGSRTVTALGLLPSRTISGTIALDIAQGDPTMMVFDLAWHEPTGIFFDELICHH